MSTTNIIFIIFGFICVCVFAIYMAQSRERARIDKIRKTNQLTDRHRRMQQLLYDLPPQYLNNELRIMIAERSVETVNGLIQLQDDSRLQRYLADDVQFLKELREKNPKFKAIPVQTEAKAKEVRDTLEMLHKFIEVQNKNKRLDMNSTKKYSQQIKLAICQSRADLFVDRAEANIKTKPRVAIHNFHSAIEAYKEFPSHPQAAKAISFYRAKIKELEILADQNNQKFKQETANTNTPEKSQQETKTSQNKEWDKFLEEGDSFQKKKNFDD